MASEGILDSRLVEAGRGGGALSEFELMAEQAAKRYQDQIAGKIVVITGISPDGIGSEAAKAIARHGAKILILASRSEKNIIKVIDWIKEDNATVCEIKPLILDLARHKSIREAATEILDMTPVIDVLINSAALAMLPEYKTVDGGVEATFGINYLGHFLLTNLLMPALLNSSSGARVVNIASSGHQVSGVPLDDLTYGNGESYEKFTAYAASKSACLLFTLSLATKLGKTRLRSLAVDPGSVMNPGMFRYVERDEAIGRGWFLPDGQPNPVLSFRTADKGAASYIVAAYNPDLVDNNGATITAGTIDKSIAPHALDPGAAEELWRASEKIVGQKFEHKEI